MLMSQIEEEDNPSKSVKNVCKRNRYKKRKKKKVCKMHNLFWVWSLSNINHNHNITPIIKLSSMPELTEQKKDEKLCSRNSVLASNINSPYRSDYIVNVASGYSSPECLNPFNNSLIQIRWKIYRCQLNTKEETCCCSCNSDAMFEVMKSLYDCYKKKNCDHCNCILCGHLPKEERRLGEMRKSDGHIASADVKTKSSKDKKQKLKKGETVDVPVLLEMKTSAEKEKNRKKQAEKSVAEGRKSSEKAFMQKVKTEATLKKSPSEKVRKAKEAGFLTPLESKTPEQKEKILRGLAMHGIPLPEGKTPSEKKLIKKVRKDVGLPPEPKTPSLKEKYKKAMETGIITPLEGKPTAKKEKILKAQADLGIPLPEGRTPSEKKLIDKVKGISKVPSVVVPSEKIRRAKTAGLLTPLTDKTPEQKEKILKGLAIEGLPLPEAKTPSEKKLLEKVRTDLGLPPEPKTEAAKEKYKKAMTAGIITPLEGKSAAEKEKILKSQGDMGIPLPEGRTPSERALIAKVKTSLRPPSEGVTSSEKIRKAKAAGILTPLEGKTPEQKEKIFKGLAMRGLPLPEAKTPSDRKIIDKVRTDLGIPPEPKTASEKDKYKKGITAGIIVPLEGKSPAEKEKILKAQAEMGIPLPQGRTSSEKALIKKLKAPKRKTKTREKRAFSPEKIQKIDKKSAKIMKEGKGPSDECICHILTPESEKRSLKPKTSKLIPQKITSEKLKSAKVAGLLTPLAGKTPAQKENILKGLAKRGLPLPEGKTTSEKKLIDKVRLDMGLPPEPKTPSAKENYAKAQAAGIITPLEGKTPSQKEKVLKKQVDMGVPLPEGRTPSEKALINKVKKSTISRVSSEKLRRAKSAGLVTPLQGKTPDQKEKILRGRIAAGLPLPPGKTPSEKELIKKVKADTGYVSTVGKIRSTAVTPSATKIEGKTPSQKEKILRSMAKQGLPLPEGKTTSEKKLIDKVRLDMGLPPEPKSPSAKENYAKAQAAGIITPLEGKTSSQKEKVLKKQVVMGVPLPEGRTPSEKALINKVKKSTMSRVSSEKLRKAKSAGLVTPLQGKTPDQKEKILRGRIAAGLPLPPGKTPSEKELIKKVKADTGYVSPVGKIRSTALTPSAIKLEGKTPSQKEKILRSMAKQGLPLPEGKTTSEKSMIRKIKTSAPSTVPSEKLRAAKAAGLLTPLSGKTPAQKEKKLKDLAKSGIPLPAGKTPSEKELIKKVRKDMGLPRESRSPSEADKTRKAYAAGLVTPLEGKTPTQKDKILKDLAKAGAPLPEGRTSSEKALIKKIQAEVMAKPSKRQVPSGLEPPALSSKKRQKLDKKTAKLMKEGKGPSDECLCSILTQESEKLVKAPSEKLRKAKEIGLSTPVEGKKSAQKEKMREKDRKMSGLSPKRTSLEKVGKVKTKSKRIGVETSKKSAKSIGAIRKSAGILEESQYIHKTTTCERGCGCDKKKIRFKHSYVKIRVTSPDFSSICPCPNECIPGVKSGVLTDNEGIKVTVGRALGVPSLSVETPKYNIPTSIYINNNFATISTDSIGKDVMYSILGELNTNPSEEIQNVFRSSVCTRSSEECLEGEFTICGRIYNNSNMYVYDYETDNNIIETDYTSCNTSQIIDSNPTPGISISIISNDCSEPPGSSFESIYLLKTESSLSLSTQSSGRVGKISVLSLVENSVASHSSHYLYYPQSETFYSDETAEEKEYFTNEIDYSIIESEVSYKSGLNGDNFRNTSYKNFTKNNDVLIFRVSGISINKLNNKSQGNKRKDKPVLIINNLNSEYDIRDMVDEIMSNNLVASDASSVFIVVASSDDVTECSGDSSSIYIQMCDNLSNWKNDIYINDKSETKRNRCSINGLKINNRSKTSYVGQSREKSTALSKIKFQRKAKKFTNRHEEFQSESIGGKVRVSTSQVASVDIACDRPCCCQLKAVIPQYHASSDHRVANVVSELVTPLIMKQGIAQGLNDKALLNLPGLGESRRLLYTPIQMEPTPVTSCIIPPCSGRKSCHDMEMSTSNVTSMSPINPSGPWQPCHCRSAKVPELTQGGLRNYADGENSMPANIPLLKPGGTGLKDKALLNIPGLGEPRQLLHSPNQVETTPVKSYIIPPCSGCKSCHDMKTSTNNVTSMPPIIPPDRWQPCHCRPTKVPELTQNGARNYARGENSKPVNIPLSKPGGTERVDAQSSPMDILNKLPAFTPIKNTSCATCHRPNLVDDIKISCSCSGKEKKGKQEPKCPCQVYNRPSSPEPVQVTKSVACQCNAKYSHKNVPESKNTCTYRIKKKGKKNIICECPEVPEVDEPLLLPSTPRVDDKLNRKMQSDLTQTTSGFKIHTQKRVPPEEEMSYEDIMYYYKSFLEEYEGDTLPDGQRCVCKSSGKKAKGVSCECPYEPPPPEPAVTEIPLKGLKFKIGAKGSGSKGLSGICCFDMLHENRRVVKFQSRSYLKL